MTILLTNDDGIDASGLAALCEALSGLDDLAVVAPRFNNSGIGHAITIHKSIRVKKLKPRKGEVVRASVQGTPADAVKFALRRLIPETPRLVVSGINLGPNVGVNVLYSGTLGAAFEGLIGGVSALAVSVSKNDTGEYGAAKYYARQITERALEMEKARQAGRIPARPFCLNLNVPAKPANEVPSLCITRHGISGYREFFHQNHDKGPDDYMVDGEMHILDADTSYDAYALAEGHASLTPLNIDMTDLAILDYLHENPR